MFLTLFQIFKLIQHILIIKKRMLMNNIVIMRGDLYCCFKTSDKCL